MALFFFIMFIKTHKKQSDAIEMNKNDMKLDKHWQNAHQISLFDRCAQCFNEWSFFSQSGIENQLFMSWEFKKTLIRHTGAAGIYLKLPSPVPKPFLFKIKSVLFNATTNKADIIYIFYLTWSEFMFTNSIVPYNYMDNLWHTNRCMHKHR